MPVLFVGFCERSLVFDPMKQINLT